LEAILCTGDIIDNIQLYNLNTSIYQSELQNHECEAQTSTVDSTEKSEHEKRGREEIEKPDTSVSLLYFDKLRRKMIKGYHISMNHSPSESKIFRGVCGITKFWIFRDIA
jgi:hypothetical protein